jgi:hypothetical protein
LHRGVSWRQIARQAFELEPIANLDAAAGDAFDHSRGFQPV